MFRVDMLPAGRGDSIWIEYGSPASPCRVLIDGGIGATARTLRARIEALPPDQRRIELLIVTHIDLDHIAGVLALLGDPPAGLSVGDVWFNGLRHLPDDDGLLGVKQGEALTQVLERASLTWNGMFGGNAVMIPDTGDLPVLTLPGGMSITLLAPNRNRLAKLRNVWEKQLEAETDPSGVGHPDEASDDGWFLASALPDVDALAAEPFKSDYSIANGSSIALVAAFDGRRCLFAGDAFARDVRQAVERLALSEGDTRLALDGFKLSHHGGRKNTSSELLSAVACRNFLFSTDSSVYAHPDWESVARVIVHGRRRGTPRLFFNYRSTENLVWSRSRLRESHRYEPIFPEEGVEGIGLDL